MKRLLFIITKSENGGAQKWVKEQIEILNTKFEIYLATDSKEGWLVQNANVKACMADKRIRKRTSLKYLMELIRFIKVNRIDLIVASSANAGLYSRLAKLFCQVKVVYVGHGWSSIYNGGRLKWLFTNIEKFLSYFTDSILCVSRSDYDRAKNEIGIDEKKLVLIQNKIKPMIKKKEEKNFPPKILSVTRFKYPKRIDLLIKAVQQLDVELYLVGDGPLKKDLERRYESAKIHFLGEIDGFQDYHKYDIFALISESEGLPLAALEAMSAGLPIVLSNVGGCPELIDKNGLLVNNDVNSIANGIKKCMDMQEIFSKNSLEIFNKKFNLLKFKSEYISYYEKVLNSTNK